MRVALPFVVVSAGLIACPGRAPRPLEPIPLAEPEAGSGVFGSWFVDDDGLPAYRYTLDQRTDARAEWFLSDGSVRRDHLFQIGNDRLIGVVDTDGFAQVFLKDRGPQFLNKLDLPGDHFGGGFSWIAHDVADLAPHTGPWATAHALAPAGARFDRVFGVQRAQSTAAFGDVVVDHELLMPPGDEPYVIDEVTITNTGPFTRALHHYEAWDVNRHWLQLQLLRSGSLGADLPTQSDRDRANLNAAFVVDVEDVELPFAGVRVRQRKDAPRRAIDEPASLDEHPLDTFLVRLSDVDGRFHTDRLAFVGDGSLQVPAAVRTGAATAPLSATTGLDQPAILVDETRLRLGPGESVTLRYAFGAVPQDAPIDVGASADVDAVELRAQVAAAARGSMAGFVVEERPELQREMAWHSAQLLGATAYDSSFDVHHTVQGSTYQYLHGLDGAARDYALFAVPLTYLRPDLARENLRMMMRMTSGVDGQISYATAGLGLAEDAVIHTNPSDLDLFFLWALSEYVVATGDRAFLDEVNPYYPRAEGLSGTVREHALTAVDHLMRDDGVGLGPHGLLRVRTGDWSDGIALQGSDRSTVLADGESIPNTQMATWVLPLAAGAIFADNSVTAASLLAFAAQLRSALGAQWLGSHYRRAWFGVDEPHGDGAMDLEAQVWGLIGQTGSSAEQITLAEQVFERIDVTSEVGAPLFGGDVWHAITGLLTWGYTRTSPERAWRSFNNHTMASYADENPAQWFGIWSGPDGIGKRGGTWGSAATPMTDWPVMNANQHAMPLMAMVRVAGVEPLPSGELLVAPTVIPTAFALDTPLLALRADPTGALDGTVRGVVDGAVVRLAIAVREGHVLSVEGEDVDVGADGRGHVSFELDEGDEAQFEVRPR
ncbi:MAG: hypothetical protein Q8O67_22365 [Deltaproteobacteria bacterium]|nr:hypothetical protein [Deltaproteobacteria bacterium]